MTSDINGRLLNLVEASPDVAGKTIRPAPFGPVALPDSTIPFCRAPHQFLLDTALQGPATRFRMHDETFLVLSDPVSIHAVLNGKPDDFEKGAMVEVLRTFLHDGMITVEGAGWIEQHAMMAPLFARRRIRQLEPHIADCVTHLIETWAALAAGQPVDIFTAAKRLTFDVVASGMLGITDRALADDLFETLYKLDRTESVRLNYLLKPLGAETQGVFERSAYAESVERIHRLTAAVAEERLVSATRTDDFLGDVMGTPAFAAFTLERKRTFLADQVSTMLTAGFVTTGESIFWGMYLLAKHPAVQERARVEVLEQTKAAISAVPVDAPPFVVAAFNESQRLFPAIWFLGRVARRNVRVGNIDIPADTRVLCSPFVLHRMPALWPDSDQYRPERFLPGATPPVTPHAFIPFSTGMRACLGRGLALMEIAAVACMTLARFELELVSDAQITFTGAFSLHPREPVMFRLKPRL